MAPQLVSPLQRCAVLDVPAGRPDEDQFGVRILAGKYSDAYLQRAAVQRGYTVVIWRGRHVVEPTDLEHEEASGYWLAPTSAQRS